MALTVADTGVLIDARRGRDPSARRVRTGMLDGSLHTTAVNAVELLSGARTAHERDVGDDCPAR